LASFFKEQFNKKTKQTPPVQLTYCLFAHSSFLDIVLLWIT